MPEDTRPLREGGYRQEEESVEPTEGSQQHTEMVSGMTNRGHFVWKEHVLLDHVLTTYLAPDRNLVRFLLINLKGRDVVYIPVHIL